MASYDITEDVNILLDRGLTPEEILNDCGVQDDVMIDIHIAAAWAKKNGITRSEESSVRSRASQRTWNEYFTRATAESVRTQKTATAEPLATPKQVALIMRLIGQGRHLEGGYVSGPTTAAGVKKMTRRGASAYIDSLLGSY